MKAKYILVAILIVALASLGIGCGVATKASGGGTFTDDQTEHKITFGFNAQASEDGTFKGQFQLVDHGVKPPLKVHGSFDGMDVAGTWYGTCRVNGEGPYDFSASFMDAGEPGADAGDLLAVWIYAPTTIFYSGFLE